VPRCGDGVRNRGVEVCDDGNFISGDGCSGDCLSQEACGNGYIDFARGEQCDSGITGLSGDGCSSTCKQEQALWSVSEPPAFPSRRYAAAAYDPRRDIALLFGGADDPNHAFGDTWIFESGRWRELRLPIAPPARYGHVMAFDPIGDQLLLFGGHTGEAFRNDTWAFKDGAWQQLAPMMEPSARYFSAMASSANKAYLYGGALDTQVLNDLWEWNGVTWQQVTVLNSLPRAGHALVFESDTLRVLGGTEEAFVVPGNVNEAALCGVVSSEWISRPCPDAPRVFSSAAMFDDIGLWGGGWANTPRTDSVEFLGELALPIGMPIAGAVGGTMVKTSTTSAVFMPGGVEVNDFTVTGEPPITIRVGDSSWDFLRTPAPAPRQGAAGAYNAHLGSTLIVGGNDDSMVYGDAWLQTRGAWTVVSTPVSARTDAAMTYDESRRVWVLFGGINGTSLLNDTWEFDGSTWTQVPGVRPSARFGHRMVYDAANARVILLGGQTHRTASTYSAETWSYQNQQWTRLTSAGGIAIGFGGLAYDRLRNRVIRFGGVTTGGVLNGQTSELVNNAWQLRPTTIAPRRRIKLMMAYDPVAGETVMFGGRVDGSLDQETWFWNGTRWAQASPAGAFEAIEGASMVYDAQQGGWLMTGGKTELGYSANASVLRQQNGIRETCDLVSADLDSDGLAGCGDPDCWGRCQPLCPPGVSCGAVEKCGDGVCNAALENDGWCPQDCP